ncbi:hypothetical protein [Mycolicibacterium austroafricanum]|uniref:hypothetical protein n=1 Tax=Mycolicibacterium austroafricanum TaxID=39687 RepID=UPI001F4397F4|nr:hypothetical protein [Mycolicibacterium austroafricanum]
MIKSNYYDSKASLLVFEENGRPVKAAGISGDYLRGADQRVTWPADVIAEPWGGGFVQFTLPQG